MNYISIVTFCMLISGSWCAHEGEFPEWFRFGAATSSYQVEGGWNASDKGENIWDRLFHTESDTPGGISGDVACDSYHLWERDIQMAAEIGLDMYRFSLSWARLLPNGFANYISEDGKRYYNDLINGLLQRGIEPVVTLYHFDLPQILQDLGGWANPLISDWFADYARVAYYLYADRVKIWLTLNEPFVVCDLGYSKQHAPFIDDTKVGKYLCNKYQVMAHAKAWRVYDEEYRQRYNGKVSLATVFYWHRPATPDDVEITQLTNEYWEGRYAYPIFSKEGGWPPTVEKFLADKAKKEGYHYRLPPFTPEEIELVRGTYDFYGLNHYTTRLVRKAKPGDNIGPWPMTGSEELGIHLENDPAWGKSGADWFPIYPDGLLQQLHWLNQTYGPNDVMITENGYLDANQHLEDWERLKYMRDNLQQIQLAIGDGLNITGYIAWALMDSFEWLAGTSINFGLFAVDFSDPNRTRTARESAHYYTRVIKTKSIQYTEFGLNYE